MIKMVSWWVSLSRLWIPPSSGTSTTTSTSPMFRAYAPIFSITAFMMTTPAVAMIPGFSSMTFMMICVFCYLQ